MAMVLTEPAPATPEPPTYPVHVVLGVTIAPVEAGAWAASLAPERVLLWIPNSPAYHWNRDGFTFEVCKHCVEPDGCGHIDSEDFWFYGCRIDTASDREA